MKQYDRIRLKSDKYRSAKLLSGAEGYVIEEYPDGNFEVEFSNGATGETIALIVLTPEEIELAE